MKNGLKFIFTITLSMFFCGEITAQTEQYSKSNGEQMSVEEWNRMKKLNDLKIYDTEPI